jgi:glycosyltransferase involved in cell wall biosynthesis
MVPAGARRRMDRSAMTAISVVMSVYNGAPTLGSTLDSILGQTERDFECIIVDDGSTDATPAILAEYAARDPRIRVIRQPNAGLTRALIAGCAEARGVYIARQDAGDLSHPARFAMQKRALDADSSVVFVSSSTQYAGPDLEPLWISRPTGAALKPAHVLDLRIPGALTDGPTHHGSVMFRRDAYHRAGGYRPAFYYGQDFDLWLRLAETGKFQAIDEVLYTARITPESISGSARSRQEQLGLISRAALEARQQGQPENGILDRAAAISPVPRRAPSSRGKGLYFIGEALRRNGDRRARRYLRRSIAAWPFSVRAWVRYLQSLVL